MKNISNIPQETSEEVFEAYSIELEFDIDGRTFINNFKLEGNVDVTIDDNIGNALNPKILDFLSSAMECFPTDLDFDTIWENTTIGKISDYDEKYENKLLNISNIQSNKKYSKVLEDMNNVVVKLMKDSK